MSVHKVRAQMEEDSGYLALSLQRESERDTMAEEVKMNR